MFEHTAMCHGVCNGIFYPDIHHINPQSYLGIRDNSPGIKKCFVFPKCSSACHLILFSIHSLSVAFPIPFCLWHSRGFCEGVCGCIIGCGSSSWANWCFQHGLYEEALVICLLINAVPIQLLCDWSWDCNRLVVHDRLEYTLFKRVSLENVTAFRSEGPSSHVPYATSPANHAHEMAYTAVTTQGRWLVEKLVRWILKKSLTNAPNVVQHRPRSKIRHPWITSKARENQWMYRGNCLVQ